MSTALEQPYSQATAQSKELCSAWRGEWVGSTLSKRLDQLQSSGLYLRNRAPAQGSFVPDADEPKSSWDPAGTRGAGQPPHQDQALLWKRSLAGCLTPGHTLRNSPALPRGTVTLPSHPQPPSRDRAHTHPSTALSLYSCSRGGCLSCRKARAGIASSLDSLRASPFHVYGCDLEWAQPHITPDVLRRGIYLFIPCQ